MNLDKIKATLKALRAKTTANGCTEAEAIAAAEKAAELLATHNLTEADLESPEFGEASGATAARRSPLDVLWPNVAQFCTCRCWVSNRPKRHVTYFGRAGDVLVAEYIHEVILGASKRAEKEFRAGTTYRARRTDKTRRHALRAFQEGFAAGVIAQLSNGLWRRLKAQYQIGNQAEAKGIILALLDPVDVAMAKRGIETTTLPSLKPTQGRFRDAARWSGAVAGRDVDIHAPVGGGATAPAALPPPRG